MKTIDKLAWTLAFSGMSLCAHAQKLPNGSYVYEGGNGQLIIRENRSFAIDTVGGNGHICGLEGDLKGDKGTVSDNACVLTFKQEGTDLRVTDNEKESCRDFCGARAGYTGLYIRPSPACSSDARARARKTFKTHYDHKDFSAAVQTLIPVLTDCKQLLNHFVEGDIRNDLALAQLRNGDALACLKTLQPLQELASLSDTEVRSVPEPAYAENYLRLARATRTNLKLCNASVR